MARKKKRIPPTGAPGAYLGREDKEYTSPTNRSYFLTEGMTPESAQAIRGFEADVSRPAVSGEVALPSFLPQYRQTTPEQRTEFRRKSTASIMGGSEEARARTEAGYQASILPAPKAPVRQVPAAVQVQQLKGQQATTAQEWAAGQKKIERGEAKTIREGTVAETQRQEAVSQQAREWKYEHPVKPSNVLLAEFERDNPGATADERNAEIVAKAKVDAKTLSYEDLTESLYKDNLQYGILPVTKWNEKTGMREQVMGKDGPAMKRMSPAQAMETAKEEATKLLAVETSAQAAPAPAPVRTVEQARTLPSGTIYRGTDGVKRQVP